MKQRIFITATDTDAGKTYVTCRLLEHYRQLGLSTLGVKPIASGAEEIAGALLNQDALLLQQHSTLPLDYERINPVVMEPAIAPHIAAKQQGLALSAKALAQACMRSYDSDADIAFFEGAGGWCVPLNETETWADFCQQLSLPVILVVGMKLGCINHAILSEQAILASGVVCHGWVANQLQPEMPVYQENIETLRQFLTSPMIGEVTWQGQLRLL